MSLEPEVTHAEAVAQPCDTCGVPIGKECDGSHYRFFLLPTRVRDIGRVHTRRYQAAIRAKEDQPCVTSTMTAS